MKTYLSPTRFSDMITKFDSVCRNWLVRNKDHPWINDDLGEQYIDLQYPCYAFKLEVYGDNDDVGLAGYLRFTGWNTEDYVYCGIDVRLDDFALMDLEYALLDKIWM